ncbi:MAG: tetratricopeptide repeat protein [Desulfobacterota bacterium]|nr:tetratricopeptide repeat protein [Thermodesulfobacteriota bacterium]
MNTYRSIGIGFLFWLCSYVFVSCVSAQVYTDIPPFRPSESIADLTTALETIYQRSLDYGTPNVIITSLSLLQQARAAMQHRSYEVALLYTSYAQKISPDLPITAALYATAEWYCHPLQVHRLLSGYLRSLFLCLSPRNIDEFCFFMVSHGMVICVALLLTLVFTACVSVMRYLRLVAHDIRHLMPRFVPDAAIVFVLVIIFIYPVVLGFSLVLCCLYWVILLFAYHTGKERIVVATIASLCIIIVPVIIGGIAFCLFVTQTDEVRLPWSLQYRCRTQRALDVLEQLHAKNTADIELMLTLGLVHQEEGNYRTARKYYENILKLSPQDYRAHTNLGNVFFALHELDAAVIHYREAIAYAPERCAAAHFNLARAYQQRFMFQEAERELEAAKKINAAIVDRYLQFYSEHYNRMLINERLPVQRFWERGYRLFLNSHGDITGIWNLLYGTVPIVGAIPIGLFALCVSAYAARREKIRLATRCQMCGKALCKRCHRMVSADLICIQCFNFLNKQETLGYAVKEARIASIKSYLAREHTLGMLCSWFAPGLGHLWKGRPFVGSMYLFVFFVFVCKLVATVLMAHPMTIGISLRQGTIVVWGLCCIIVWLLGSISAMRCKNLHCPSAAQLQHIALDL